MTNNSHSQRSARRWAVLVLTALVVGALIGRFAAQLWGAQ